MSAQSYAEAQEDHQAYLEDCAGILQLVEEAVQDMVEQGFGNYMTTIQRALQGKAPKKRKLNPYAKPSKVRNSG